MTRIRTGALSNVGQKRARNEDYLVRDDTLGLYVVVDGMGGHARGDVAARAIGEAMQGFVARTSNEDDLQSSSSDDGLSRTGNRLKSAALVADREIARRVRESEELRGMGATMAAVLIDHDMAAVAHAGDCRVYLLRQNGIQRLTADHSWVAGLIREGALRESDASRHPLRNVVTRSLTGDDPPVKIDVRDLRLENGDRLLLCCDGVHGLITDAELLLQVQAQSDDPQQACDALVDLANARGAPDNVSVIVIRIDSD